MPYKEAIETNLKPIEITFPTFDGKTIKPSFFSLFFAPQVYQLTSDPWEQTWKSIEPGLALAHADSNVD